MAEPPSYRLAPRVAVFPFLSELEINNPWGPKGGRPRRNRHGKSAVHAGPEDGEKGITGETRGRKRPKAQLIFLLDTRGRPRPPLKSPHGGPQAGTQRANTRQHPGPQWTNEAPSLGGRYSVQTVGGSALSLFLGYFLAISRRHRHVVGNHEVARRATSRRRRAHQRSTLPYNYAAALCIRLLAIFIG